MMSPNLISIAIPANLIHFNFDAATSVVAIGKAEVYLKKGLQVPLGWAINSESKDEIHPQTIIDCVCLYPLGGASELFGSHKGYGLSVIVEFLSACLSQGVTSNHSMKPNGKAGICHFFAAIDPNIFGNAATIKEQFSHYLQEIR